MKYRQYVRVYFLLALLIVDNLDCTSHIIAHFMAVFKHQTVYIFY